MGQEQQAQKLAIVTGATDGIGFDLAKFLICEGYRLIAVGRNPDKGVEKVAELNLAAGRARRGGLAEYGQADMASLKSVQKFVHNFLARNLPLDLLVNNAGTAIIPDDTTEDGFELTVGTNHFGPFFLTHALLDKLKDNRQSRVVWTTSSTELMNDIDFDDLEGRTQQGSFKQYGRSKVMNQMICRELGKRLKGTAVYNVAAWPGAIKTGIWDKMSFWKPMAILMNILIRLVGMSSENGATSLMYASTAPQSELEAYGASGEVMFGPYHARPFASIFGTGYPLIMVQGWSFSGTLNCMADKPKNPLVYDDEACRRLVQ